MAKDKKSELLISEKEFYKQLEEWENAKKYDPDKPFPLEAFKKQLAEEEELIQGPYFQPHEYSLPDEVHSKIMKALKDQQIGWRDVEGLVLESVRYGHQDVPFPLDMLNKEVTVWEVAKKDNPELPFPRTLLNKEIISRKIINFSNILESKIKEGMFPKFDKELSLLKKQPKLRINRNDQLWRDKRVEFYSQFNQWENARKEDPNIPFPLEAFKKQLALYQEINVRPDPRGAYHIPDHPRPALPRAEQIIADLEEFGMESGIVRSMECRARKYNHPDVPFPLEIVEQEVAKWKEAINNKLEVKFSVHLLNEKVMDWKVKHFPEIIRSKAKEGTLEQFEKELTHAYFTNEKLWQNKAEPQVLESKSVGIEQNQQPKNQPEVNKEQPAPQKQDKIQEAEAQPKQESLEKIEEPKAPNVYPAPHPIQKILNIISGGKLFNDECSKYKTYKQEEIKYQQQLKAYEEAKKGEKKDAKYPQELEKSEKKDLSQEKLNMQQNADKIVDKKMELAQKEALPSKQVFVNNRKAKEIDQQVQNKQKAKARREAMKEKIARHM